jgi:addiction module HigA family antidote
VSHIAPSCTSRSSPFAEWEDRRNALALIAPYALKGRIMPVKNQPYPGRGLKDDIDALGLTVAEAADALGVTRQQLYNVLNGRSGITAEMALRFEKGVGGTADA